MSLQKIYIVLILLLSGTIYGKQIPSIVGIMKTDPLYMTPVVIGMPSSMNSINTVPVTGAADYDVRNTISLKYDLNTDTFFMNSTEVVVELQIDRWDMAGVPFPSINKKLRININNYLNRPIVDESIVNLKGGYQVNVTIARIWINGIFVFTLPKYVSVESEINLDRYYDFSSTGNTLPYNIQLNGLDKDCDGSDDELEVVWTTPLAIPEEYQVEWYFVNNYSGSVGGTMPMSAFTTDFKNNSTRITTTANSYKISLLYPSGYIVVRVRAVGRDYLNPTKFIYGNWNVGDQVNLGSLSSFHTYTIVPHEKIKNWQYSSTFAEEGKKKEVMSYFDGSLRNRQTVTKNNSDKNVIVGETIYDFQGRPAVNILPVPVPLTCGAPGAENVIKYWSKFNVDDTNKVYSKNDFDSDLGGVCTSGAAPLDTASGASKYYSNNNPNKTNQQAYLPHAKEYPFTQIEYTPDNTGRIRNQSGLGKDFRLGTGRETKYLYGQPNQIQLDRLFGSEVGDASHYKKNVVIDPNGQTSVTYMNQEGKTIATGLAGVPPTVGAGTVTRMDSLEYAAQNQTKFTVDLFNNNANGQSNVNTLSPSNDALVFSTELLVEFKSVYDFRYTLNVPTLPDACLKSGVCVSCIYDMEIQVKDECGQDLIPTVSPFTPAKRVTGNVSISGTQLTFNTNCSMPVLKDSVKVSLTLNPGVYTVNKILKVNSQARDYYTKIYTDSVYNSCVQTLYQFNHAELLLTDTLDCYNSCSSCVSALGTRDDYVSSGKGTAEQWDFLVNQCNEPCRQKTICQLTYDMMLSDVSPGGQYGRFDQTTYVASNEQVSVFNEQNILRPNNITGQVANWRSPMMILNGNIYKMYLDENGVRNRVLLNETSPGIYQPQVNNPSLVFIDNASGQKCTYPENLLNLSDFIQIWNSNYARSLVVFHPEYAYYVSCSDYSIKYAGDVRTSDDLDSLMYVTESFNDAVSKGFINSWNWNSATPAINKIASIWSSSSPSIPYDPFFTNNVFQYNTPQTNLSMPFNIQTEMNNVINNYNNTGYTMPAIAAYIARCGNNFGSNLPSASCLDFGLNYYTGTTPLNDTIRNKEWRIFKQLYYAEKQKLQWKRMNFYAQHLDGPNSNYYGGCNACIGNSGYNFVTSKMITLSTGGSPNPYPQSPFYDLSQPCGQASYTGYAGVVKRFYDPANTGLNTNVGSALYNATGQCPMAFKLQNFLHAMASGNLLITGTYAMNTIPEFDPDLYAAVYGGAPPATYVNHNWQSTASGNVFTANFVDPFSVIKCTITINKPSSIPSFGNINGFKQLVFDPSGGSDGAFKAVAIYMVSGYTLSANVTGNVSCMNLKRCTFDSECEPNQFASDMMNFLSYVKSTGQFGSTTNVDLSAISGSPPDTTITKYVTPSIKSSLFGNSWLRYKFVAPDQLVFTDFTNSTATLILTYTVTSGNLTLAKSFANIKSYYASNLYTMDGFDQSGALVVSISGRAIRLTGTGASLVTQTLALGNCALPEPVECNQKEHKVRKDLEVLINEILCKKTFTTGSMNLYYGQISQFTPLLRSYISPTVSGTSSTFYTYTGTSLGSSNYDSLVINFQNSTSNFVLYRREFGTQYKFYDLTQVSGLIGTGPQDLAGNYYSFKARATFTYGGYEIYDTICGTSCWPIKNCLPCKNPPQGPINTFTYSTAFNRSLNVPYNGSNNRFTDPWWQVVRIQSLDANWQLTGTPTITSQQAYDVNTMGGGMIVPGAGCINIVKDTASGPNVIAITYKTTFNLPNPFPANTTYSMFIKARADDAIMRINVNGANYFVGLSGNIYGGPAAYSAVYAPQLVPGLNTIEIDAADLGLEYYGMLAEVIVTEYENKPCDNGPPDTVFVFPQYTKYDNPCVKQKINLAYQNGALKYQQYINNIITTFADKYTKHCMSALEKFTYKYTDKEYHHTLYYYDQAGNLIKTIPPEGVESLPITAYTDPLEVKINNDRTNNQQTVFTNHRMPSKYLYNSLNQLTYQSIPDHDNMDICDGINPNGIDTGLVINAIQFLNASKGYLCGYIKMAGKVNRGYVYTTSDGGNSWSRSNGVTSGDFQKVQFASTTVGYAVSTFGMVFKTSDGGNSWDLLTGLYTSISPRYVDLLNDLYFSSNSFGVVGGIMQAGASSPLFYTSNGGGTWFAASFTNPSDIAVGDTITSITNDGAGNWVASTRNQLTSKIFTSLNGTSWTKANVAANNLTRIQFINPSMAYAIGEEGTLMKLDATISTNPIFRLVPTGVNGKIIDVYFKNGTDGVAIIDSAINKGKIFKTFNGGLSWQQLSANGEYYNSLQLYDTTNHKLIAGGKNGLLSKVLLSSSPFGITKITTPNTREIRFADIKDPGNNNLSAIAVGNNAVLYTCYDAQVASPTWYTVNTYPTYISTPADTSFKKVLLQASAPTSPNLRGILLTNSGKLYSFYRTFNSAIVINALTISGAIFNDISTNDQSFTPGYIYAFDTVSKKNYQITFSSTTPIWTQFNGAVTGNINAIDMMNSGNRIIMVGNAGHIEYASNVTNPTTWSNVSLNTIPVAINRIKAIKSGNFIAVGIDGAIWRNDGGVNNWYLRNSGTIQRLNSVATDVNGNGLICATNGKLFRLTNALTLPALTSISSGVTAHLTDVTLETTNSNAYVTANNGQVLYLSNYISSNPSIASQVSPYSINGVIFRPGNEALAVGNKAFMAKYYSANAIEVKDIFSKNLISIHFNDANNGFVIDSNNVIRRTSDGGNSWSVILPRPTSPALTKVFATNSNEGVLIGLNRFANQIVGTALTSVITGTNLLPAGTHFYDISFDPTKSVGFIVGSSGYVAKIISNAVSLIGQVTTAGPPDLRTVHVFNGNSFITAGTKGKIYYYKNSGGFVLQDNYLPPVNGSKTLLTFKDIYFHDAYTGYVVGNAGAAYRVGLNDSIGNLGLTSSTLQWKAFCSSGIYMNSGTYPKIRRLDFNAIGFSSRINMMVGGADSNVVIAGFAPARYARLLKEESGFYSSRFWYDKLGRLVLSQNTKQFNKLNPADNTVSQAFSYTLYDALGRITEVGEKYENHAGGPKMKTILGSYVNGFYNNNSIDDVKFKLWINGVGSRREVTKTYYDAQSILAGGNTQNNLRKRVATTTYEYVFDGNDNTYNHATHYSYDIHGNVNTLWQENPFAGIGGQELKRIDYNYDLISGKVNEVVYSPGELDQFIHRYSYDADNRIVLVETSKDDLHYDLDAKYYYYDHGPLARVEYGKDHVQGIDYAYTLQGWIKGVNSNSLKETNDIGRDGDLSFTNPNGYFARDIVGYSLNYYQEDYAAIDYVKWNTASTRFEAYKSGSDLLVNNYDLYNGNISSMATTISQIDTLPPGQVIGSQTYPLGNVYRYDQLNRLKRSLSYDNFDQSSNAWSNNGASIPRMYRNTFTYDAMGNINTQVKYDSNGSFTDSLTYNYDKVNGKLLRNRLYHVNDFVTTTPSNFGDIKNQGLFTSGTLINNSNNYSYDEIGNLIKDKSELIDTIRWTVSGKVRAIIRKPGSPSDNLFFEYDASGNRIAKHVHTSSNSWKNSTYYIRDAQGNVMGTYKKEVVSSGLSYKWNEQHLYGSSRIGMALPDFEMIGAMPPDDTTKSYLGQKQYELSNHLGNVISVISDKKIAIEDPANPNFVSYYLPDLITATDYYAFGSPMPGRQYNNSSYRYGFNGKENDNEVKGTGNSLDYGARINDPRLGRFLSIDPLFNKQVSWSPYSQSGDNPIRNIDVDGLYFTGNTTIVKQIYVLTSALAAKGDKDAIAFKAALEKMDASDVEFNVQLESKRFEGQGKGGDTKFDFKNNRVAMTVNDYFQDAGPASTEAATAHELKHGSQFLESELDFYDTEGDGMGDGLRPSRGGAYDRTDEYAAIDVQTMIEKQGSFKDSQKIDEQAKSQKTQYTDRELPKTEVTTDKNSQKNPKYMSADKYKPNEKQKNESKKILTN